VIATGGPNGGDEARFALLARDMVERGVWFDLRIRGELYRNKPPLYPWLIAAGSRLTGRVTEATAQAPVALAAIAAVLFTFLLGDRLFGRRAGLWAALVLATSPDFFDNSQALLPDMLVTAFAAAAGWAFWRSVSEPTARAALVWLYVALALGVFAKGPVGLLPLLAAAVWIGTAEGAGAIGPRLWSPVGIALFAGITLGWLAPFLALGSRSFAGDVLWEDWLAWYVGAPTRPWGLAYTVAIGGLPWTLLLPMAIGRAARAWSNPRVRFAFLWLTVPLAALTLSAHQKPRYSVLVYPGAALLVGWWADAHGAGARRAGGLVGWLALGAAAALILALQVPAWWGIRLRPFIPGPSWVMLPVLAGIALAAVALFRGLREGRPALLVHGVAAAMAVVLACGIWPYDTRYNQVWDARRLVARAETWAENGEAAVFRHHADWLSMDFYAGRALLSVNEPRPLDAYLARPGRPVVIIRDGDWRAMAPQLSVNARILERFTIGTETVLLVGRGG
jgi:4-amino-4-deoxy-L-arabinose transferase-like glycosyltransferase